MTTYDQVEQHFKTHNFFPADADIWEPGHSVYEFPFIQKVNENKFVVHIQRHYAINPFQLAEKAEWPFDSLVSAYQKWYKLENKIFD